MKRLFLIFLFLLISCPAWATNYFPFIAGEPEVRAYFALPNPTGSVKDLNEQIKLIKAGGSVTLSGLTAQFSNVAGFQFVTNPSVDLRKWIGYYITFTSSAGNTLKVKVSAAGTGETLGDTLNISNCENSSFVTFDGASSSGFHAVSDASAQRGGTADELAFIQYGLYKTVYTATLTTGTSNASLRSALTGTLNTNLNANVSGSNSFYTTWPDASTNGVVSFRSVSTVSEFTIADLAAKQVLTPTATGIYFTDPVVTGTFNYNAASFTAVVTRQ